MNHEMQVPAIVSPSSCAEGTSDLKRAAGPTLMALTDSGRLNLYKTFSLPLTTLGMNIADDGQRYRGNSQKADMRLPVSDKIAQSRLAAHYVSSWGEVVAEHS